MFEPKFNLANNVIGAIHKIVVETKTSYMEAIVHYAEETDLEIDVIADIIKKNDFIKSQLEIEAEALHFLKRKSRLPV